MKRAIAAGLVAVALGLWLSWWLGAWLDPEEVDTVRAGALADALAPDPSLGISAAQTDVVLVALCTLRTDRLEPYGHDQPTSPFLDQLAGQGVRFAHNFAQAPWTRPSMAALMTGLWPRGMRIDNLNSGEAFRRRIGDQHTLLAEYLSAAGYNTVGVVTNPNLKEMFGFAQGFDAYDEPAGRYRDKPYRKTAAEAVDTALELAGAVPDGERLYLRLNVLDTHQPRRYARRYLSLMESGPGARRDYDAALRTVDAQLARLFVSLKAQRPNLLFVVAADHGEGLTLPRHHGPGHGNHVYRTTVETPLMWHHPGLAAPGRVVEGLSMNIDVVPTVMDLLGLEVPEVDGQSQAAAILGEADRGAWEQVYSETFFQDTHASTVFDGRLQLIRTHGGQRPTNEVYRAEDWQAEDNVWAAELQDAAQLARALTAWEAEQDALEAAAKDDGQVPLDETTSQMLQELGYLE